MSERSELTAKRIEVLAPYRWKPGQSGNVNGKAGVLAKRIRQATNQGREIFEFLLSVMRDPNESTRNRVAASEMLLNRAFGRPRQEIEVSRDPAESNRQATVAAVLKKLPVAVLLQLQDALAPTADPSPVKIPNSISD